ncbi:hypothetical protein JTB14_035812 [Gonioctena quinquepunctata]|nr:hypothetical protein JTB14_035812 [Gonioctena quinquepunctata]
MDAIFIALSLSQIYYSFGRYYNSIFNFRTANRTQVANLTLLSSFYPTFVNANQKFIKGYKKGQEAVWCDGVQESSIVFVEELVTATVLAIPNFSLPFVTSCDASDSELGCVRTKGHDEKEKIIALASRSLSKLKQNYTVTEEECFAYKYVIITKNQKAHIKNFKLFVNAVPYTIEELENPTDSLNTELESSLPKIQPKNKSAPSTPTTTHHSSKELEDTPSISEIPDVTEPQLKKQTTRTEILKHHIHENTESKSPITTKPSTNNPNRNQPMKMKEIKETRSLRNKQTIN